MSLPSNKSLGASHGRSHPSNRYGGGPRGAKPPKAKPLPPPLTLAQLERVVVQAQARGPEHVVPVTPVDLEMCQSAATRVFQAIPKTPVGMLAIGAGSAVAGRDVPSLVDSVKAVEKGAAAADRGGDDVVALLCYRIALCWAQAVDGAEVVSHTRLSFLCLSWWFCGTEQCLCGLTSRCTSGEQGPKEARPAC